jgi:hypothetical protein
VRAQRVTAFAVTLPILLVIGMLRFTAARIGGDVAAAREAGDCAGVTATVQKYWFGHRVADAPRTARDENDVDYCARIDVARSRLETVLTGGDTKELAFGFGILGSVLKEPGQEQTVATALDEFLTSLPKNEACANVQIAAWLRTRTPDHTSLDRSRVVAPQIEPNALLGCADKRAGGQQWVEARGLYQQLVDRYPKAKQTVRARAGVQKANLSIELGNVRSLVADEGYCSKPARYSGAAPYRHGLNRALFLGDADEYTDKLPSQWQTTDPYRATLIVCAETPTEGTPVRTCPYTSHEHPGSFPVDVTFHKIAIPLKAYELRTGRLVASTTLQIDGTACPRSFAFESYVEYVDYVPSTQDVITTNATIQAAFKPVVVG